MNEASINKAPPIKETSNILASAGELELPPFYLHFLKTDFNIDAQLTAISELLDRNRKSTTEFEGQIKKIEEYLRQLEGVYADEAVSTWIDHVHQYAYLGAAHSMSALGMLAPFIETIFCQCFRGIKTLYALSSRPKNGHQRWKAEDKVFWDCHKVITSKKPGNNIVQGILQLSKAIGLADKLPEDLKATLSALFAYRNKMFHNGFEWPINERISFAKQIKKESWPTGWFTVALSGSDPWIFYMSDTFINHCFNTTIEVLNIIGEFVRVEILPYVPTDAFNNLDIESLPCAKPS